jgi:hypothetical protein
LFVALDKALWARLTGAPRNSLGQPSDPVGNPGVRLPKYQSNVNDMRQASFDPTKVIPNQFQPVPVFKRSGSGKEWRDQYPAIVYDLVSAQPRGALAPVGQNLIRVPNTSPTATVRDAQGRIIQQGQTMITAVPPPIPFDVLVQIECQSRIQYEAMLLVQAVLAVFPARGALNLPFASGLRHLCDMMLMDSIVLTEDEDVALSASGDSHGAYREHRYVMTYLVEAFQDTTQLTPVIEVPAVRNVRTELAFSGQQDADNVETQSSVVEVINLTS